MFLFYSCGQEVKQTVEENINDTTTANPSHMADVSDQGVNITTQFKYDNVISAIPMPVQILEDINKAGLKYKANLCNPHTNASKYSTDKAKAINLGIYGADLGYAIAYMQLPDAAKCVATTSDFAEKLGVPYAFGCEFLVKYDKFQGNNDSLITLVYDAYSIIDQTLRSNQRIGIAALVLVGSWLETMYISTVLLVENPDNEILKNKLPDQKNHLSNILKLLEEFRGNSEYNDVISGLQDITSHIKSIPSLEKITGDELKKLSELVSTFRSELIK